MKAFVTALAQAAAIHFEKVARREIGAFTTPKTKSRSKILTPPASGKEPAKSYSRVPISYSILDSIGHCFQVNRNLSCPIRLTTYSTMYSIFFITQCDVQYGRLWCRDAPCHPFLSHHSSSPNRSLSSSPGRPPRPLTAYRALKTSLRMYTKPLCPFKSKTVIIPN